MEGKLKWALFGIYWPTDLYNTCSGPFLVQKLLDSELKLNAINETKQWTLTLLNSILWKCE